jgi:hypothetical protein
MKDMSMDKLSASSSGAIRCNVHDMMLASCWAPSRWRGFMKIKRARFRAFAEKIIRSLGREMAQMNRWKRTSARNEALLQGSPCGEMQVMVTYRAFLSGLAVSVPNQAHRFQQ